MDDGILNKLEKALEKAGAKDGNLDVQALPELLKKIDPNLTDKEAKQLVA